MRDPKFFGLKVMFDTLKSLWSPKDDASSASNRAGGQEKGGGAGAGGAEADSGGAGGDGTPADSATPFGLGDSGAAPRKRGNLFLTTHHLRPIFEFLGMKMTEMDLQVPYLPACQRASLACLLAGPKGRGVQIHTSLARPQTHKNRHMRACACACAPACVRACVGGFAGCVRACRRCLPRWT